MNGFRYYILFVDHYSRFTWLYLLKSKTEAFSKFVYFHALIKTQFSATIKCFRLDGGGEFTSNEFKSYLSHHGISCHLSCPYTPQQNGVVERKHRHVVKTTVTMLSQASMPSSYWSFAAQTTVSLNNILPTSMLNWVSPWTKLFSTTPDLTQLKVFGCACYPNLRPYNTHKLEPKTRECVFIGYPSHSKGYLCLD